MNKKLVYSPCIMYFVKKFTIFENGYFLRYKSDKGKGQNAMSQFQSISQKFVFDYAREIQGKSDRI